MKKFRRKKLAFALACASILSSKAQARNENEPQSPQTVAAVGGAATKNSNKGFINWVKDHRLGVGIGSALTVATAAALTILGFKYLGKKDLGKKDDDGDPNKKSNTEKDGGTKENKDKQFENKEVKAATEVVDRDKSKSNYNNENKVEFRKLLYKKVEEIPDQEIKKALLCFIDRINTSGEIYELNRELLGYLCFGEATISGVKYDGYNYDNYDEEKIENAYGSLIRALKDSLSGSTPKDFSFNFYSHANEKGNAALEIRFTYNDKEKNKKTTLTLRVFNCHDIDEGVVIIYCYPNPYDSINNHIRFDFEYDELSNFNLNHNIKI